MEKALAIVVRGTDWSETSRIATLWTREFGKVRALAKGGRRLRSNFEVAFDLLTVCRIVFIRKHAGGLDLLTEAQVAERFPALRTDLRALYVGYYIAELLADGTQDYDPHPALFDTAMESLRSLGNPLTPQPPLPQRGEGEPESGLAPLSPASLRARGRGAGGEGLVGESPLPPPPSVGEGRGGAREAAFYAATVSAFELAWLRELGYSPRLERCAVCDSDLIGAPALAARLGYSPTAGGAVCAVCLPAARDSRLISNGAWLALRSLATGERILPDAHRREVRQVLGHAVSSILGRRPRLLGYVDGG